MLKVKGLSGRPRRVLYPTWTCLLSTVFFDWLAPPPPPHPNFPSNPTPAHPSTCLSAAS